MSPASRWSRNCTPLTTRPSLTSRHAMILRAGTAKRLLKRDSAFPKRLADDRAVGRQALQIGHHGDSAGRLDRRIGQPPRDFFVKLHVRPEQHAIAADVGDEEMAGFRI